MRPRRIEVDVRELVLDGLSPRDRGAVVDALRRGLPEALQDHRRDVTARRVETDVQAVVESRLRPARTSS